MRRSLPTHGRAGQAGASPGRGRAILAGRLPPPSSLLRRWGSGPSAEISQQGGPGGCRPAPSNSRDHGWDFAPLNTVPGPAVTESPQPRWTFSCGIVTVYIGGLCLISPSCPPRACTTSLAFPMQVWNKWSGGPNPRILRGDETIGAFQTDPTWGRCGSGDQGHRGCL